MALLAPKRHHMKYLEFCFRGWNLSSHEASDKLTRPTQGSTFWIRCGPPGGITVVLSQSWNARGNAPPPRWQQSTRFACPLSGVERSESQAACGCTDGQGLHADKRSQQALHCFLWLEIRKRAGSVLSPPKSACPDFWQIFGKWLFQRRHGKREK